ncbi:hypothetical protein L513_3581 [Bordetella bronchiseptica MBORD632]|nr:hypothetical protein L513_3581 [Bordetella bronchiseptica MBORD632]
MTARNWREPLSAATIGIARIARAWQPTTTNFPHRRSSHDRSTIHRGAGCLLRNPRATAGGIEQTTLRRRCRRGPRDYCLGLHRRVPSAAPGEGAGLLTPFTTSHATTAASATRRAAFAGSSSKPWRKAKAAASIAAATTSRWISCGISPGSIGLTIEASVNVGWEVMSRPLLLLSQLRPDAPPIALAKALGALPLPLKLAALTQTVRRKGAGHGGAGTAAPAGSCRREYRGLGGNHRRPRPATARRTTATPRGPSRSNVRATRGSDARRRRSVFGFIADRAAQRARHAERFDFQKRVAASPSISSHLLLGRHGVGRAWMVSPIKVGIGSLAELLCQATNALLVSIRSQQIGPLQRKPLPSCEVENVAVVGRPQGVPAERRIGGSYTFLIYAGETRLKLFHRIALYLWRDRYDYDPTRGCPGEQNNISLWTRLRPARNRLIAVLLNGQLWLAFLGGGFAIGAALLPGYLDRVKTGQQVNTNAGELLLRCVQEANHVLRCRPVSDGQDEIVSDVDGPSLDSNRPGRESPAQNVKHE